VLEFLVLPAFWLYFYLVGLLPGRGRLTRRQAIVSVASLLILFLATGIRTTGFYLAVGLAIVLVGLWLQSAPESRRRRLVRGLAVAAVVALIALYLGFRVYFQKYFEGLPSLSYLGFRGIAFLVTASTAGGVTLASGFAEMFFLPMVFLGPIARVENFQEEHHDLVGVLKRLAMGLPMLIAAKLIEPYVLERLLDIGGVPVWKYWLGAVANSFQFYFTFAGYSHLVIGLGLLAGFRLPENFNNPYIARSIGDFWRRWHMSLSFWIRDYVYIPLGGNRRGLARKCVHLLVAMGVCGLWHGLELHYLLWGLWHGALLAIESVFKDRGWHPLERLLGAAYAPVKVVLIFGLVTFGWLLFKYPMPDFFAYMGGLIPWIAQRS